jgi:hypothetical protein
VENMKSAQYADLEKLQSSVIYLLAAPSTPESARTESITVNLRSFAEIEANLHARVTRFSSFEPPFCGASQPSRACDPITNISKVSNRDKLSHSCVLGGIAKLAVVAQDERSRAGVCGVVCPKKAKSAGSPTDFISETDSLRRCLLTFHPPAASLQIEISGFR